MGLFLGIKILLYCFSVSRAELSVPGRFSRCRIGKSAGTARCGFCRGDFRCLRRDSQNFILRVVKKAGWQYRFLEFGVLQVRFLSECNGSITATAVDATSTGLTSCFVPAGNVSGRESGTALMLLPAGRSGAARTLASCLAEFF